MKGFIRFINLLAPQRRGLVEVILKTHHPLPHRQHQYHF
jgi:hypothetical protein